MFGVGRGRREKSLDARDDRGRMVWGEKNRVSANNGIRDKKNKRQEEWTKQDKKDHIR